MGAFGDFKLQSIFAIFALGYVIIGMAPVLATEHSDYFSVKNACNAIGGSGGSPCWINGEGTIDPGETILFDILVNDSGTLNISEGAYLWPDYNVTNHGTINNYGSVLLASYDFTNSGIINNYNTFEITAGSNTNSGLINNFGTFEYNNSGFCNETDSQCNFSNWEGFIDNSGTLIISAPIGYGGYRNNESGTMIINDGGGINPYGVPGLPNFGEITLNGGWIRSTIFNDGIIANNGTIDKVQHNSGTYSGSGSILEGDPSGDKDGDGHYIGVEPEDCNDNDPNINPGIIDNVYDGIDSDCSGGPREGIDLDFDGFFENIPPYDCDDNDPAVNPGASEIPNDGIDNDCEGRDFISDYDGDGFFVDSEPMDCSDTNADIYPGAPEIANDGIDQDCDGVDLITDLDGDGFFTDSDRLDCNDNDATIYPGAPEYPNDGIDQDCDGVDSTEALLSIETEKNSYKAGAEIRFSGIAQPILTHQEIEVIITSPSGVTIDSQFTNIKGDNSFEGRFEDTNKWKETGEYTITALSPPEFGQHIFFFEGSTNAEPILSELISIQTRSSEYIWGEEIRYDGFVDSSIANEDRIEIIVTSPAGQTMINDIRSIRGDQTFNGKFETATDNWSEYGTYTISAIVGPHVGETQFEFDSSRILGFGGITTETEYVSTQALAIMDSEPTTSIAGDQDYSYGYKAAPTLLTETNSDKVCGLSLCTEELTMKERLQYYLQAMGFSISLD